ncbi:hypothetical protein Tco_0078407 [Tanacetum coccineum]
MNNSITIAYRFKITLQLCLFDGSKSKNNDELQPRLSNYFKNFDSNGGDDLCYQGKVHNLVPQEIDVESTSDNDARDQASELETKVLVDSKQDDAKVVKVVGVADEQNSDESNVLEGNEVIGVGEKENNKGVDKELEFKVLVDGKQDDTKVVKVVGVADEQNSDEPNMVEVIKKKNIEAAIQRSLWDPRIKSSFQDNILRERVDKEVQYFVYTLHVRILFLKRLNDKYIKKKKMEAATQRRLWDPRIKSAFQDNTLRARSYQLVISLRVLVERASDLGLKKTVHDYYSPEYLFIELRSNPTTLGEALSLSRITKACFEDQRSSSFTKKSSNNSGQQKPKLDNVTFYYATSKPIDEAVFVKVEQAIDVESTPDNDARDQASKLEMKVLVDSKQDDVKVDKVVGVADEQNSDEPNVLEVEDEIYSFGRSLHLIPYNRSNVLRINEPLDEAVFVKVNDETKGFSTTECIEENNVQQVIDVESMSDNDARDQASEFETKVLVDSKQDDAKVVKVVRVANEQNSDVPNVLEGNGVIVVGVNENNKGVDKEVKHSIYTLHVLILFLKLLNDKYIKKKKMKAAIQKSRFIGTIH